MRLLMSIFWPLPAHPDGGYWMALSSPFPSVTIAVLKISMACSNVSYEVAFMSTSMRAMRTNKGLFSSMRSIMYCKLGFTYGLVATNITLKIPSHFIMW